MIKPIWNQFKIKASKASIQQKLLYSFKFQTEKNLPYHIIKRFVMDPFYQRKAAKIIFEVR